jgi:hypothetical protein
MLEVFQRLARQTASQLQIPYPERVEKDILSYLHNLKENSGDLQATPR